MSHFMNTVLHEAAKFIKPVTCFEVCVRNASKKTIGATHNAGNARPKYRGVKAQDGHYVQKGVILVTQTKTRFHPGMNVSFGTNGDLVAMDAGKVMVTCEKINPDYRHFWVRKNYTGRENQVIYKKHFNVIPDKQHDRFIFKEAI